jgi:hypothetical protein
VTPAASPGVGVRAFTLGLAQSKPLTAVETNVLYAVARRRACGGGGHLPSAFGCR